jgi:hypothetical protein
VLTYRALFMRLNMLPLESFRCSLYVTVMTLVGFQRHIMRMLVDLPSLSTMPSRWELVLPRLVFVLRGNGWAPQHH